jgi:RimJ/RimL family protein N-acetyltransferase
LRIYIVKTILSVYAYFHGILIKTGKILRRFIAKDGREVILRTPKREDLDDLLELINSLVEEDAEILIDKKLSREEEADWLSRTLAQLEKGNKVHMVAEVDGKVIASSGITKRRYGCEKHVGNLGIIIKAEYRDLGVGTEMMKTLIDHARIMEIKILTFDVYATNNRALHVYEKVGFKKTGRIPKRYYKKGKYIDGIIMTKEIL